MVEIIENISSFDVVICAAEKDCNNLDKVADQLRQNLSFKEIKVISNTEPKQIFGKGSYINENNILSGLSYSAVEDYFIKRDIKPTKVGWYLQQFIKMAYALICKDEYYLIWDADTLMLHKIDFFDSEGRICFDNSRDWEDDVFNNTVFSVLGYHRNTKETFVVEHMMVKTDYMKELIGKIVANRAENVEDFWRVILDQIVDEDLIYGGFSEFELIGTFMKKEHSDKITFRPLVSKRNIVNVIGDNINKYDLWYFSQKYDFITLEKLHKLNLGRCKMLKNKVRHFAAYYFAKLLK